MRPSLRLSLPDDLAAANLAIHVKNAEIVALKKEVERLKHEWSDAEDRFQMMAEQRIAENAALREKLAALEKESTEMLNSASIWRNRAISAEEELAGMNRLRKNS